MSQGDRLKGVMSTLAGSFARLTIALAMGIISSLYFLFQYYPMEGYLKGMVVVGAIAILFMLLFGYFQMYLLANLFPRTKFFNKIRHYLRVFALYSFRDLGVVLGLGVAAIPRI